jgi:hypothetical protein
MPDLPDTPEDKWIRMSKSQAIDLIERLLKDIHEVRFRVEGNLAALRHSTHAAIST